MPSSLVDVPINSINMKFDTKDIRSLEDLAKFMVEKFSRLQDEINRQNRQLFDILVSSLGTAAYTDKIVQSQLSTSTNSQSGSVGVLGIITLPLDAYTFYVAHELEIPGTLGTDIPSLGFPVPAPDADSPGLTFKNNDSGALLYAAEWRHVDL